MATEYLKLDELASLLGRSRTTILNDRVRNPAAVPPAIKPPGTKVLLWRREDVDEWLAGHLEGKGEAVERPAPRRGRPRKV